MTDNSQPTNDYSNLSTEQIDAKISNIEGALGYHSDIKRANAMLRQRYGIGGGS
jgi:hypothetical protein